MHTFLFFPPARTLTELLKQPGEAGVVDGTGVHHPIGMGTNGISARVLRSNNGQFSTRLCLVICASLHANLPKHVQNIINRMWGNACVDIMSKMSLCCIDLLKLACWTASPALSSEVVSAERCTWVSKTYCYVCSKLKKYQERKCSSTVSIVTDEYNCSSSKSKLLSLTDKLNVLIKTSENTVHSISVHFWLKLSCWISASSRVWAVELGQAEPRCSWSLPPWTQVAIQAYFTDQKAHGLLC